MNILFLMGMYPNYGGVEMVSTVLANRFINDGHNITIASFSQPIPDFAEQHLSNRCKLLKLSRPVLSLKNILLLRQYVKAQHINVLINQWVVPFFTTLVWKVALYKTDCKVYSVHHNKPDTNKRIQKLDILIGKGKIYLKPLRFVVYEISRISLAFCIRCSDKYILLSSSFIPMVKKFSRISDANKYIALANPVTVPEIIPKEIAKKKEIIYVGRIEYNQKRTYRVIDIWKELESKYQDWSLIIIGDGSDKDDLDRRIKKYDLKRVLITGFINPLEYYKHASIMLMTSEYEGFPLVLTESMTYGVVPVVYNSFESVNDIIVNGQNGFLVNKPFSTEAFVQTLHILLDNESKLRLLSANAIEMSKRFGIDNIVKEWYNLIEHHG